ncbi:hypothetical protein A2164_00440 [Candidatus Curtissbacteria bacterium RBG_13_35_7]|uniref:Uncharacterized protein n=1 Tax=Candidatus Curtissbacteria bacterium RBG_13_35_7 TaxID=1797705 RepID=A0A1F5G253_9BACT|nr:MAG: hypothetical protein A2164_00440 [Candidatus Curtissbacteria bacterium RBG_13_35_7]
MPFKTRSHKKKAIERRVIISKQGLISYKFRGKKPENIEDSKKTVNGSDLLTSDNYSYVGRDIYQIILLASIIISLQIILNILI